MADIDYLARGDESSRTALRDAERRMDGTRSPTQPNGSPDAIADWRSIQTARDEKQFLVRDHLVNELSHASDYKMSVGGWVGSRFAEPKPETSDVKEYEKYLVDRADSVPEADKRYAANLYKDLAAAAAGEVTSQN